MAEIPAIFTPGINSIIYLPINGEVVEYVASLKVGLSGAITLDPCYDKYGIAWKWSTLELNTLTGDGGLSSTLVPYPSSWYTTECLSLTGTYPKKWRGEGTLSAELFTPIPPQTCSATQITWSLSSNNWIEPRTEINPLSTTESFVYRLSLKDFGLEYPYVSYYEDTNLILTAVISADCVDTLVSPPTADTFVVERVFNILSVAPPTFKIYTPNRYVLTGTNIKFENLSTQLKYITRLVINLDDNQVITLTGEDIFGSFSASYNTIGYKNISFAAYVDYQEAPYTTTFPNVIQVLSEYDEVFPEKYLPTTTPINLPWTIQPQVDRNDWIVENNINSCFDKFNDNLNYLITRGETYPGTYSDYFGYLGNQPTTTTTNITGCPILTWEDTDIFNTDVANYASTWRDFLSSSSSTVDNGRWVNDSCATWISHQCGDSRFNPVCWGKYCIEWNWRARESTNSLQVITWQQTVSAGEFAKRWYYEPCIVTPAPFVCDEGTWNVNIKGIDQYYNIESALPAQPRCFYYGIVSIDNRLYLAQKTSIKVLSSDYTATYKGLRYTLDDVINFSNIVSIAKDSDNKIFVVDNILSQIAAYKYDWDSNTWELFTNWGGFGSSTSTNKFSNPIDVHIDQLDNVWVCDNGNTCIKHYSNSGTWIRTIIDDRFKTSPPLSISVDSEQNLHILTKKEVLVYSYTGVYLYNYSFITDFDLTPNRIRASYNREIMYISSSNQVTKYFRTGAFAGNVVKSNPLITNITDVYHDEFRNLLVTVDDKILKYPDIMSLIKLKGTLPTSYWSLEDIYIHKEEYIQNWVYTRSFQRMWDNIELFRNSLLYSDCRPYIPPVHDKSKMIIGQNEIVTSTVINRVLGYLWENLLTIIKYYNTDCTS